MGKKKSPVEIQRGLDNLEQVVSWLMEQGVSEARIYSVLDAAFREANA